MHAGRTGRMPVFRHEAARVQADLVPKLMQRLGFRERLPEAEVIGAWSKIAGEFIAAHSAPVALRETVLYVRVLQPALHYELEQVTTIDILAMTRNSTLPRPTSSRRLSGVAPYSP